MHPRGWAYSRTPRVPPAAAGRPPAAAGTLSSAKTRGPPAKTVLAVARPLPPAAPLCRMRGQTKQRRASRRPTIRAQPVRRRPVPGLVKSKPIWREDGDPGTC